VTRVTQESLPGKETNRPPRGGRREDKDMTMKTCFSIDPIGPVLPIWPVEVGRVPAWLGSRPPVQSAWAKASGFEPELGRTLLLPGEEGRPEGVLLCLGQEPDLWAFSAAARSLPEGDYRVVLEAGSPAGLGQAAALGWALGTYEFTRFRTKPARSLPKLVPPPGVDLTLAEALARATFLVRDLVNTPAEEMGPAELAQAAGRVAEEGGARVEVIAGEELVRRNFPSIYLVGRGSRREPLLIDLSWGSEEDPAVVLVGKGVCFDSGGLDLKKPESMLAMKNDMAGAAHALGLAGLVMTTGLPVRLRVLIPAVENMPSGRSYRPGDILKTRQGIFVEISNTDAEGRIILSDALTEGSALSPRLMIDFATLTGAARVALGPTLPAFFSNDDDLARDLARLGREAGDPLWPLPLHRPYRRLLESEVADIRNAVTEAPQGGAITAALFLSEFVALGVPWAHLDIPGGREKAEPGRPKGADAFGLRAVWALLAERFGV